MGAVVPVVEGIIEIIQKNLIAKTNAVSNVLTGDILVNVENSFHFVAGQEAVLIDYGYNNPSSPHYQKFEYVVVKEVNNTHWITLEQPVADTNGWYIANGAFIQKTIGHSPLYDDRVYYGDREVIPTEEMAITIEPQSLSNEWIYIQGGLSEEYRMGINIYGKDINTEEGMKILNKYTDAVYELFNKDLHLHINDYETPLLANVAAGTTTVIVEDTTEGRENLRVSSINKDDQTYEIQDNLGIEIDLSITAISTPGDGNMYITVSRGYASLTPLPLVRPYNTQEFAVFRQHNRYFYDSRIDNIEYGMVQKGSAFIRAAKLNWFGKEVTEHRFPQKSVRGNYFPEITNQLEVSSSSSSSSSSSG